MSSSLLRLGGLRAGRFVSHCQFPLSFVGAVTRSRHAVESLDMLRVSGSTEADSGDWYCIVRCAFATPQNLDRVSG
jgi:hypothetical protein